MEGQSGGTFSKKWRDRCGVFSVQEPERGKIPLLLLFLPKTYPCGAKVLCDYTLLYIVDGGICWLLLGGCMGRGELIREE